MSAESLFRDVGDERGLCQTLREQSFYNATLGRYAAALEAGERAAEIARRLGEPLLELETTIAREASQFASVAVGLGETRTGSQLVAFWDAAAGRPRDLYQPAWKKLRLELETRARAALGDDAFEQAWQEGAALTADEAVELAMGITADGA